MIYAELKCDSHYSDIHDGLVKYVELKFPLVQSGLQGDSWIWIFQDDEKVAIDTFWSEAHQVKSSGTHSKLVHEVIQYLSSKYTMVLYEPPEFEPNDELPSE